MTFGPGTKKSEARCDEAERVDGQPEAVLVEVAGELSPQRGDGLRLVEIVGIEKAGVSLATQVPEQPLLGDALRNPAHHARLERTPSSRPAPSPRAPAPFALRFREHLAEALAQPAEEAEDRLAHASEDPRRALSGSDVRGAAFRPRLLGSSGTSQ